MPIPLDLTAFVPPSHPILCKVAEPVTENDLAWPRLATLQDWIQRMWRVAYGEQKDPSKPLLVGLAAPQIGIPKRMILVDVAADGRGKVGDLRLYINPEIISASLETGEWYEACYSTGCVCGIVSRPECIRIRALDVNGHPIEEEHSGYTARIFQHEIDHLNGVEFVSHITDDDKLHWVEAGQFPAYRNNGAWRNWPHTCSRIRWNKIKNGS